MDPTKHVLWSKKGRKEGESPSDPRTHGPKIEGEPLHRGASSPAPPCRSMIHLNHSVLTVRNFRAKNIHCGGPEIIIQGSCGENCMLVFV
jgi:hypothetical protein